MCNAKKRIGIFVGGIDVIKVNNFKINLVLTQHKWHNIFILRIVYQLPFKMFIVKKRIGIFMGRIDVIKLKNLKINLALTQHKFNNIFIFEWHINCHSKCAMSRKELVFLREVLMK